MADAKLGATLQQAVLAVLCFDQKWGTVISAQVLPVHFDNTYRDFAHRVLTFRRRYGRPPGPNYLADLAAQVNFGRDNKLLQQELVPDLMAQAEGLNGEYIAGRVQDFIRRQIIKGAIIEAGDRYSQDDDTMPEDIERIFHKALTARQQTLDAGLFLNDPAGLQYYEQQDEGFVSLGIPELDRLGIGLTPKELLLYIGPKGSGKTWFCTHCGRSALLQRMRVVHYTLEMGERKILRRYHQSLFGVARNGDRYNQTVLEIDELGRLSGFDTQRVKPKISFSDPGVIKVLRNKMKGFGTRLGGLLVKNFPTGSLTCEQIDSHLDYMGEVHGFFPNVMIVDYPDLMSIDERQFRVSMGRTFVGLRGIGVRRNMAVVTPTQGGRHTIQAKRVRSRDVTEDISKVMTADTVLAFSRTEQEERLNLGRLGVEHARDSEGGSTILLAQSYHTGQYVLKSAPISQRYWDQLKEERGEEDEE